MNDSLSYVEKKINYRIQELKDKMEKTNLRAETELYKFDLHKRLNPLFTTHMILDHKYQE